MDYLNQFLNTSCFFKEARGFYVATPVCDVEFHQNSNDVLHSPIQYNEKIFSVQVTQSPSTSPPSLNNPLQSELPKAEGGDDDPVVKDSRLQVQSQNDSDNDDENGGCSDEELDELPKTFQKARPFSEQRENKFTSTLRRLSTVRKKSKMKKKEVKDRSDDHDDSSAEIATAATTVFPPNRIPEIRRPSSTTSRESDIDALTSGYFR